MRQSFRQRIPITLYVSFVLGAIALLATPAAVRAQRYAVVDPAATDLSKRFVSELASEFGRKVSVLDLSLTASAFLAFAPDDPFNLDARTAGDIGSAIGCRYYVIVRTSLQRRSSFGKGEYFEAWAALYLVSARSGELVHWELFSFEGPTGETASQSLFSSAPSAAAKLAEAGNRVEAENRHDPRSNVISVQADAAAEGIRPPMPYRRIKPVYTLLADLYSISATVDIEADIDVDGSVLGTRIVRWAGFGLDDSVRDAVNKMQWRPGEQKGQALPMRVLLRYNFRDIDDEN